VKHFLNGKLRRQLLDDGKKLSARLIKLHYKGESKIKAKALEYFRDYVEAKSQLTKANKPAPSNNNCLQHNP
jgi:hypothetical protein